MNAIHPKDKSVSETRVFLRSSNTLRKTLPRNSGLIVLAFSPDTFELDYAAFGLKSMTSEQREAMLATLEDLKSKLYAVAA